MKPLQGKESAGVWTDWFHTASIGAVAIYMASCSHFRSAWLGGWFTCESASCARSGFREPRIVLVPVIIHSRTVATRSQENDLLELE